MATKFELKTILEGIDTDVANLRSHADKLRMVLEANPDSDTPRATAWAENIMRRHREGPSILDLVVAVAILETNGSLPRAAKHLLERFESELLESENLTRILTNFFYADKDHVTASNAAKARASRFRAAMIHSQDSFVLDDEIAMKQYQAHHLARLRPDETTGEIPRLIVVDVLARNGLTVLAELRSIIKNLDSSSRKNLAHESIIARVIRQERDPTVDKQLQAIANDAALCSELRARDIAVWFRCPASPLGRVPPGVVHGNWITSVPYEAGDDKCREIHLKLWRGEEIDGLRAHHLYLGVHAGSPDNPDVYNHFELEAASTAILATQAQLAHVHTRYWRATVPNHEPGVFEII